VLLRRANGLRHEVVAHAAVVELRCDERARVGEVLVDRDARGVCALLHLVAERLELVDVVVEGGEVVDVDRDGAAPVVEVDELLGDADGGRDHVARAGGSDAQAHENSPAVFAREEAAVVVARADERELGVVAGEVALDGEAALRGEQQALGERGHAADSARRRGHLVVELLRVLEVAQDLLRVVGDVEDVDGAERGLARRDGLEVPALEQQARVLRGQVRVHDVARSVELDARRGVFVERGADEELDGVLDAGDGRRVRGLEVEHGVVVDLRPALRLHHVVGGVVAFCDGGV
jgi:hypothetical protein